MPQIEYLLQAGRRDSSLSLSNSTKCPDDSCGVLAPGAGPWLVQPKDYSNVAPQISFRAPIPQRALLNRHVHSFVVHGSATASGGNVLPLLPGSTGTSMMSFTLRFVRMR